MISPDAPLGFNFDLVQFGKWADHPLLQVATAVLTICKALAEKDPRWTDRQKMEFDEWVKSKTAQLIKQVGDEITPLLLAEKWGQVKELPDMLWSIAQKRGAPEDAKRIDIYLIHSQLAVRMGIPPTSRLLWEQLHDSPHTAAVTPKLDISGLVRECNRAGLRLQTDSEMAKFRRAFTSLKRSKGRKPTPSELREKLAPETDAFKRLMDSQIEAIIKLYALGGRRSSGLESLFGAD